jgi:hypothetical protein
VFTFICAFVLSFVFLLCCFVWSAGDDAKRSVVSGGGGKTAVGVASALVTFICALF